MPECPEDLARFTSLDVGLAVSVRGHTWMLYGPDNITRRVAHHPRLVTGDLLTLRGTAVEGLGVAALPRFMCREQLASGELVEVLPDWQPQAANVHAVYPSREGLASAVREFLEFVTPRMEQAIQNSQEP